MPTTTSAAPRCASAADPQTLRASLERLTGDRVEVRETHCSAVLLTADRAYKLKKPVRFDFVDQRSVEARGAACRHELEINRAMAPGIGVAVRTVVPAPDGYALSDARDPAAIDHLVEMRRFDEGATMRALLEHGTLTLAQARAVGAAIAAFHDAAAPARSAPDVRALIHRNLEALLPLAAGLVPTPELVALQRFGDAFVVGFAEVLVARACRGRIVDGHGDLRAEHILLDGDRVLAVDRLEWDELRQVDVADDLAFLLMDLESRGGGDVAAAVVEGYAGGGGGPQPAALLAFYGAYRAQVRAKVALLRAAQASSGGAGAAEAGRLLALARRLAWRARGPLVLLVTGPPASGKSTLAAALGTASGLPVLASDVVRREGDGPGPRYGAGARTAVYRRLATATAHRRAAIVDATFGEAALQRAFLDDLGEYGPLLAIECVAPAEVRVERAAARARAGGSASDAGPDVARHLGERFTLLAGLPGDARLAVDTQAPVDVQVDEVEAWLDARLARGTGL